MYTPPNSPPDYDRLSPPRSTPRSPRPRGMMGVDPTVLRHLSELRSSTPQAFIQNPALMTEIPLFLSPSPSLPSSPQTPRTPEDSPFLVGMSRSGSGASIPIFLDGGSHATETFGLGIGDAEALRAAIIKEDKETAYESTFRKYSGSTGSSSSISTLDRSRPQAGSLGSYSSTSTAATTVTNSSTPPPSRTEKKQQETTPRRRQNPLIYSPTTPPRSTSLPKAKSPLKNSPKSPRVNKELPQPPALFPVDYSLTRTGPSSTTLDDIVDFNRSPRSVIRDLPATPLVSPMSSPPRASRSSLLSSPFAAKRDSGYSRVSNIDLDAKEVVGDQKMSLELVIDQEGFREVRVRFDFFRQDGGVLEFVAAAKGAKYPFHSSHLQRQPTLRRVHQGEDYDQDYLRREVSLVVSKNGLYKAAMQDSHGALRYCLIYEVTDRLSLNATVLPGEKLLRPILFLCAPAFLHPSRGRKVGLLSILAKVCTSPGSSTLFRAGAKS